MEALAVSEGGAHGLNANTVIELSPAYRLPSAPIAGWMYARLPPVEMLQMAAPVEPLIAYSNGVLSPTNTTPAASMVGEPRKRGLPVPKVHRPAPVAALNAYKYLLPAPPPTTTNPPRTAGVDHENSAVLEAELFWAAHAMDPSAGLRAYTPVLPAT